MEFVHKPVMLEECLSALNLRDDGVYMDCTLGGGGHSERILSHLDGGRLIGVDKDADAIETCKARFAKYGDKFVPIKADYSNVNEVLKAARVDKLDGALMDLGVSSYQLDNHERGFSYMSADSALDMRMDREQGQSAYDVVNFYTQAELRRILSEYGEEKCAASIAANIVKYRQIKPVETTGELNEIIDKSIPYALKRGGHPSKRTFQAIRIEVNGELRQLAQAVTEITRNLKIGGRLAVITFHSLEDRIVKQTFKELAIDCVCPTGTPICICNKISEVEILTRKPILPTKNELAENPRSASAKLRVVEKKQ